MVKIMVDYDVKVAGLKPIGEGMAACRSRRFRYTNHDFSPAEMLREG
jgi:GDPmannose 4,6-dehydratase